MTAPGAPRFVLVPGFWLGAWAWDRVAAPLRAAGTEVSALTLPGLESRESARAGVALDDHVAAVVAALRAHAGRSVLVGHSGAGPVVYGATDRAPELVSRAVYVDSGPLPEGAAVAPDLDPAVTEVPLPSWEELAADGSSVEGLSPADLEEFRRRAVPHPAGPAREPLQLGDPRRRDVPVTVVTSSFRPADVRRFVAAGSPYFAEVGALDVELVDLPTGHWPMWSRPDDLAAVLLEAGRRHGRDGRVG